MAVTVSYDTIRMDAAGDEVLMPLIVQSVRFVAEAGNTAGDVVRLVDPTNTSIDVWRKVVTGPTDNEPDLLTSGARTGRTWHNGVRLEELTDNDGFVLIRYT